MRKEDELGLILRVLLILCFSPLLILGLHIGLQRGARWLHRKLPAQIGAFMAIFCASIMIVYAEWQTMNDIISSSSENIFFILVYVLIVYLMIGFLYMSFLNLSETSLHIHILMEIAKRGELSKVSLEKEYNKDTLTDTKIDRLISLGLLRSQGDRLYSGNKGYLYYGYFFDFWRRLVGMPTTPKSIKMDYPHK